MYMGAIKCLLGVRKTTPNYPCLLEAGFPPLDALIKHRQHCFYTKIYSERDGMSDDPLMFVLGLTQRFNSKTFEYIQNLISHDSYIPQQFDRLRNTVAASSRTKLSLYHLINPMGVVHSIYTRRRDFIPEYCRLAFTRMRLSSHRLRVETGRWARIPREQRRCPCGQVQDEEHVLLLCPLSDHLRPLGAPVPIFPDILQDACVFDDFKFVYDILSFFE